MKKSVSFFQLGVSAGVLLCGWRGTAAVVPVEPGALYLNASAGDVQLFDADGRPLAFGFYPQSKYVTASPDAAKADAELVKVDPEKLPKDGLPIDHASFFNESSKLVRNDGHSVEVGKCGYALSIPLPLAVDVAFDPVCKRWADDWQHLPYRIYYDRDFNYVGQSYGHHGFCPPKNAAFFRLHCVFGPHNRNLRLVKARLRSDIAAPDPVAAAPLHPGEIVLAKGADVRERLAATEIVRLVRKMTGKTLPVVNAPGKDAAFRIVVGGRAGTGDAFAIEKRGKDVCLRGGSPRGVLFAMARLFEQVTDMLCFRPNEDCGLVYTCGETVDFLKARDETGAPAFPLRTWSYSGSSLDFDRWALHNYCTRTYGFDDEIFTPLAYKDKCFGYYCAIGGSFLSLPMRQKHDDSFWPVINGKRQVDVWSGQPCYTNPKVVEATMASVDELLADPPEEWDYFGYDYSDSWKCCECSECQKSVKYPGGELEMKSVIPQEDPHFRAARTYLVGDRIARRVREKTGKPTEMLAYIYNSAPPPFRLDEGLHVLFATYDTSTMRRPTLEHTWPSTYAAESWGRRFQNWLDFNPKAIGMYEYFFTAAPGMYAEAAAANMREMAKAGGWHVHSQTQFDDPRKSYESFGRNEQMWDTNALEEWVIARLMWDPSQDPKALRSRAIRRFYGEAAAPAMEDYYATFAKKWFDTAYGRSFNCHVPAGTAYVDYFVRAKCEARLLKDLAEARAKTPNAVAKRHLEKTLATLAEMKASAGRDEIPAAGALAGDEWRDFGSPQWNHALRMPDFHAFSMTELTVTNVPASKTEVLFAADASYLYFRVAFDGKAACRTDRVELRFKVPRHERMFLFSADGTAEDYDDFNVRYASGWDFATGTRDNLRWFTGIIPIDAVRREKTADLEYLLARTDATGERSFVRMEARRGHFYPGTCGRMYSEIGVEAESDFGRIRKFPARRDWPDPKRMHGRKSIATFDVAGGKGYALSFDAWATPGFLPPDPDLLAEASTFSYDVFWHWHVCFFDAAGKAVGTEGGFTRAIRSATPERVRDAFVAPTNAVKAELLLVPPYPNHFADAFAEKVKLVDCPLPKGFLIDPTFATGHARVDWTGRTDGCGLRTFAGVRVFDTAYGSFSRAFPVTPGVEYRVSGDRWVYAGHHPVAVWCLDAKGKCLREMATPRGLAGGPFTLDFVPPEGTSRARLFIHSSYLKNIQVREK